jgi:hypothetical protein
MKVWRMSSGEKVVSTEDKTAVIVSWQSNLFLQESSACFEKENSGILKYENRQVGQNCCEMCEIGKHLVLRSKTVKSLVKQEIIPVR